MTTLTGFLALTANIGFQTLADSISESEYRTLVLGNPAPSRASVGSIAPNIVLDRADGNKTIELRKLRGRPVVLSFGSAT